MKFAAMTVFATRLSAGLLTAALLAVPAQAADLTGAGASFPAPIYGKWADAYQKATGNKINYQSIGSGGGIKQITAKTVDFGASDMPLKPEDLDKSGLMQFPTVIGGVVPVVNLAGVKPGELKMTGALLADIFLGKITKWNDKALAELNPGIALPATDIGVVRRADGSGTSFIFTNYLSKVSEEWKSKVGEGTAVQWPVGLGGKGNEGVSAFVQRLPGSIGYVEYAYAKQNKLTYAILKNAAGNFVAPDDLTFKAAAAGADWTKSSFYEILTNEPGKDAWPITGATFILMQKVQDKPAQGTEVLKFFEWSYKNGVKMAEELDYVSLPDALVKLIHTSWGQIKDASGKPVYSAK
jgi:phosphate transport system substrate-binding protein